MSNPYYTVSGNPGTASAGASAPIRSEFASIATGFDKLPTLSGNANKAVIINGAGTALTVTTGGLALAGNLTTTGAFNTSLTQQANVTLILPAVNGTLATLAGTETLTNKTLAGVTVLAGGSSFSGTMTHAGTSIFTGTFILNGSAVINGDLGTSGDLSSGGDLNVAVDLIVAGGAGVTGNAVIGGTLNVGGTTTLGNSAVNGTLNVSGATMFAAALSASGSVVFGLDLDVGNNTDIGGTLTVLGTTALANMTAAGFINATTEFRVATIKVVGARNTGWTAMTGTPDESTAYATSTVTLPQLAGRVAAIQAALTTHGLLGA